MSPSVAARPLFFAASAWPLSLRTFLAPSTSPSDSSRARFTSIIPAAVSSRSCLIFSTVLAKVFTSPRCLCSFLLAPHLGRAQALLRLLPPRAPRRPPARPLRYRSPPPQAVRRPRLRQLPPQPPSSPQARPRPRTRPRVRA